MLLEHGVYTAALAVIVGMIYVQYFPNRLNLAWVVFFAMFIPDTDYIVRIGIEQVTRAQSFIQHGDFHNVLVLFLASIIIGGIIARVFKYEYIDTILCFAIGFTAHMLEDAFVYSTSYSYLAPFSWKVQHTGILLSTRDIFFKGILVGSTNVMFVGFMFLSLMILIRCSIQGHGWLNTYIILPWSFINSIKDRIMGVIRIPIEKVTRIFTIIGLYDDMRGKQT